MLFTRCPDCDTTFRITAEALRKAEGQVRCGRCACVFDAYSELRETAEGVTPPTGARTGTVPVAKAEEDGSAPAGDGAGEPGEDRRCGDDAANALDRVTLAGVMDELESSEEAEEREPDVAVEQPAVEQPAWVILDGGERSARSSRFWAVGGALALVLLAAQVTHHFRAQIAASPIVGPWLQEAYAVLGSEIDPQWDLDQYEIVDWVAMAEPSASGRGSLKIAARIRNRGPKAQPFPLVHVQLKDRWDSTVGSRTFAPDEYLPSDTATRAMQPGETVRAELDIVDPGPDAYGFELDHCLDAGAGALRCAADQVFR